MWMSAREQIIYNIAHYELLPTFY